VANDPLIGTSLGHFLIERRIAVGGMGVIYQATHGVIGRKAAIKVLSEDYSSDKSMIKRLHREARTVNQIGHPNIIDIFDFGQTPDGREYFIMEFLQGESMAQVLEKQPRLPWSMISAIMTQLLDALAAAHDQGIVHRDIKPENIMVATQDDGQTLTKVLDFGISKPMTLGPEGERLTRAGVVLGTPEYIAPEQIRGKEVDGRADLYAAGVILYELIMGKRPFESDEVINLLMMHLKEPTPSMEGIAPEQRVPQFVPSVVNRAMAKNPDQRYPDARTFARALELETSAVAPSDGTRPLPQMLWEKEEAQARGGGGTLPMPQPTSPGLGPKQQQGAAFPAVAQGAPTAPLPGSPSIQVPGMPTAPGTIIPTQMMGQEKKRGLPVALIAVLALLVLGGGGAGLYFGVLRKDSNNGKPIVTDDPKADAGPATAVLKKVEIQALFQQVRRVLREGTRNVAVDVRRTSIRGIGKLRDDDAFALLTSLLKDDPDRVVRSAAAIAIADLGVSDGATVLRKARSQSSDTMKVWIDEALMRLGAPDGRLGLRKALRSKDRSVRFQAALALGEAGDKAALPVLETEAKLIAASPDQQTLILILGNLARLNHADSYKRLEGVLSTEKDKVIKLGAAEVLAKLGHEEALSTLKKLLTSTDRTSQLVAATILAKLGDFSGLDALSAGVKAKDLATRRLAAEGLGSIGDKAALPPLATVIEDPKWEIKSTAAEALAKILSLMPSALVRRSQDWIKTALSNRDWSVRHAAVGVTSEMDPELAISLLGWAFTDKDPRVRAAAVAMLAKIKSDKTVPLLKRALADPSDIVRVQAARGLGKVGGTAVKEDLQKNLRDESPIVTAEIAGALLAMGDTTLVKDLKVAAKSKNPKLRQAAVRALAKWKNPAADKLLVQALKDKSARVRLSAAYQLARRKNKAGAEELRKGTEAGGPSAGQAIEGLVALGLKPTKEVTTLSRSKRAEDRRQAAGSAHLIAPGAAVKVLKRSSRDSNAKVRLAAALSLTRLATKQRATVPMLRRLSRDPVPAVRAQANIGLAKARRAHSDLAALDKGEVKPVETAPLPPRPKRKPRPAIPKNQLKQRPLFVNVNSPQQLFMYYSSRAFVLIERGQFAAALRSLRMARRQKAGRALPCEFGYVYHQMAFAQIRAGKPGKARTSLKSAKNKYTQCLASGSGKLRSRAKAGLRDVKRTLKLTR
jgi:serine/threonine protein kinase/HEAT repeat protein